MDTNNNLPPGLNPGAGFPGGQQPKPLHTPSLVLAIVGAVFALILPIVTYPTAIPALVMAARRLGTHKAMAALVISIAALAVALVNSALGAFIAVSGVI